MWLASCYMLLSWFIETSMSNSWNSGKLVTNIDSHNLEPVVQQLISTPSYPSIVLVLDVSATMEYQERIKKIGTALHEWIHIIPSGLLLGMVEFSTHEELLNNLTLVDATTRKQLVQSVPTRGQGETCIGCGVRLALQVLGKRKGILVLVTDGQNTEPGQFISDVQPDVVESGTKVISVGFGDMAPLHDLKQLANASGGLFFYVSDQDAVQGLLGALKEALKLVKSQVDKTSGMTQNSTTEDSQWPTDLPVPATTLNSKQQTTGLRNTTNSHIVPGKTYRTSPLLLILGIAATVVGSVILLAFIVLLTLHKCAVTGARGRCQL